MNGKTFLPGDPSGYHNKKMNLPATLNPNGSLNDTIGALYIGTLASTLLYGFCLLQASLYFRRYGSGQDVWYIKTAVISLLTFDTIQLFLIAIGVYHYVIWNYHDSDKLQYLTWPIVIEAFFVVANGGIVQIFYIFRVCRLSHNKPICCFILFLAISEIVLGITWVVLAMRMKTYNDLLKLSPLAITIHVLSCAIDLLISGSLCFLLHRARTGFKRSDTIINKLILFIISTGIVTTLFAILAFISLLVAPYSLIYAGFYFCLGHLYTNSFLTTLNARSTLVDENEFKKCNITPQATPLETMTSNCKLRNTIVDTEVGQDKEKTLTGSIQDGYDIETNHYILPVKEDL